MSHHKRDVKRVEETLPALYCFLYSLFFKIHVQACTSSDIQYHHLSVKRKHPLHFSSTHPSRGEDKKERIRNRRCHPQVVHFYFEGHPNASLLLDIFETPPLKNEENTNIREHHSHTIHVTNDSLPCHRYHPRILLHILFAQIPECIKSVVRIHLSKVFTLSTLSPPSLFNTSLYSLHFRVCTLFPILRLESILDRALSVKTKRNDSSRIALAN